MGQRDRRMKENKRNVKYLFTDINFIIIFLFYLFIYLFFKIF